MTDIHETDAWKKMVAEVDRQVAAEGGSTGSNMAEPPWIPPGPIRIPDGLPPEERERRERLRDELMKDPGFRKILV